MVHYVCPVCLGVANHPKVCDTPGCAGEGHDLVACHCTDNKHKEVLGAKKDKEK